MQKIFISIPWFTPAFKAGGPVQSIHNMVAELGEGYEFYIFSSNNDLYGLPLHITQTDTWTPFNANTQVWYAGKADRSKNLLEQVERIKPDSIFIIGLFDWHFNLVPLFFCKGVKKILSARGMLHPGALSQKPWKKKIFLQVVKWLQLQKRTSFHATDATESGYIKSHFGKDSFVFEAGNFARRINPSPGAPKIKGQLLLISIGIVSPMKNTLLVLEALQHCRERIQYDIYGPVKDTIYWEKCLQQIKLLPANIRVHYHKEISPAEVPGKLNAGEVFIMPSKSENFGHAIVEALYAGLPVITSHYTPWHQLESKKAGFNVPARIDIPVPAREDTNQGRESKKAGFNVPARIDMTVPARENTNRGHANEIGKTISFFAEMSEQEFQLWRDGAKRYAENAVDKEKLKNEYAAMFFS